MSRMLKIGQIRRRSDIPRVRALQLNHRYAQERTCADGASMEPHGTAIGLSRSLTGGRHDQNRAALSSRHLPAPRRPGQPAGHMSDTTSLHRTLIRHLRRLNLNPASSPSDAAWREFLDLLSTTYTEGDDEHFSLQQTIGVLHEALSRQALQDTLTGLPNRAALIRHLDQSLAACARAGQALPVLFVV